NRPGVVEPARGFVVNSDRTVLLDDESGAVERRARVRGQAQSERAQELSAGVEDIDRPIAGEHRDAGTVDSERPSVLGLGTEPNRVAADEPIERPARSGAILRTNGKDDQ